MKKELRDGGGQGHRLEQLPNAQRGVGYRVVAGPNPHACQQGRQSRQRSDGEQRSESPGVHYRQP